MPGFLTAIGTALAFERVLGFIELALAVGLLDRGLVVEVIQDHEAADRCDDGGCDQANLGQALCMSQRHGRVAGDQPSGDCADHIRNIPMPKQTTANATNQ